MMGYPVRITALWLEVLYCTRNETMGFWLDVVGHKAILAELRPEVPELLLSVMGLPGTCKMVIRCTSYN